LSESFAGLYLHVPFCDRVCPYCDFAVRTGDRARRLRYVEHLLAEIDLWTDETLVFDTIYFGGGTPSSLEPEDLGRILERLRARLRFDERVWTFIEVNPEHVTAERAAASSDCTPRLTVSTPSARHADACSGVTCSGLTSRNVHTRSAKRSRSRSLSRIRARSSGSSADGVPPPK